VVPDEASTNPGIAKNPAEELLGTLEERLVLTGPSLRFVLKVANIEREASAVVISPDQGGAGIPVTIIRHTDAKVTLLNGRWSQSGNGFR
jgi:hypothetical protein